MGCHSGVIFAALRGLNSESSYLINPAVILESAIVYMYLSEENKSMKEE